MPTRAATDPTDPGDLKRPIGITQTSAYYLDQAARYGVIPAAGCCALAERIEELLA